MTAFRDADARELEIWDDLTVHPHGGHVYQSKAWATNRAARGWTPHFLVGEDGSATLAIERPWPVVGGASAYLPRGPIPAGDAAAMAGRLEGVTEWLAGRGVDVLASDAEVPAGLGYEDAIGRLGFRQIEEIEPSRHRMGIALGRGADEEAVLAGASKSTRQRIRAAEKAGTIVVRYDATLGEEDDVGDGFRRPRDEAFGALDRFYDLLVETGERRHFELGPRHAALAWWLAAQEAGHLVLFEARSDDGDVLAGLVLYRHGGRLSTVHSGDHAASRSSHPGVLHLLRWRAIQLAIREGRAEMDLGGADVAGARRPPREGEPMYGLYEHKRGFGAEWIELVGAHERVIRGWRYAAGRAASALVAVAARRNPGP